MSFEGIVALLGSFGTIVGLLVAIGIFMMAAWLVAGARKGNRHVREVRDDPHASHVPGRRRDIRQ